jgi:hypothetical protein
VRQAAAALNGQKAGENAGQKIGQHAQPTKARVERSARAFLFAGKNVKINP